MSEFKEGDRVKVEFETVVGSSRDCICTGEVTVVGKMYLDEVVRAGGKVEVVRKPIEPGDFFGTAAGRGVFFATKEGYVSMAGYAAGTVTKFPLEKINDMSYVVITPDEAARRIASRQAD